MKELYYADFVCCNDGISIVPKKHRSDEYHIKAYDDIDKALFLCLYSNMSRIGLSHRNDKIVILELEAGAFQSELNKIAYLYTIDPIGFTYIGCNEFRKKKPALVIEQISMIPSLLGELETNDKYELIEYDKISDFKNNIKEGDKL